MIVHVAGMYQRDPEMAADSEFEPGRLEHVVVGNEGRLLDPRRTPVRVLGIRPEVGLFEVEVIAFEDAGARWELPLEAVERFQFARTSTHADAHNIAVFKDAVRLFDRRLDVEVDPRRRQETLVRLSRERAVAATWFEEESGWGRGERTINLALGTGDPRLFGDLGAFMTTRGLAALEREFAARTFRIRVSSSSRPRRLRSPSSGWRPITGRYYGIQACSKVTGAARDESSTSSPVWLSSTPCSPGQVMIASTSIGGCHSRAQSHFGPPGPSSRRPSAAASPKHNPSSGQRGRRPSWPASG